jgi:hypothetical protein
MSNKKETAIVKQEEIKKEPEIEWATTELILDNGTIIYAHYDANYIEHVWNMIEVAMKNYSLLGDAGEGELTLEDDTGFVYDEINGHKIMGIRY